MKFKVFVSGNQTELRKERRAISEAIKSTPVIKDFFKPFLFEDSPASGDTAKFTFVEEVKKSDIYIGVLGNVYGKQNEFGISASETEYDVFSDSVTDGEKLIFVKGSDDASREPEVMKFFEKTKDFSKYNRFESTEDLKDKIISSLESFLKKKGSISFDDFDEKINPNLTYDVIDEDEVKNFLRKRAIKLEVGLPNISNKEILLNILKVVKEINGEIRPTNAGILFFSQDASNYIPQNEIRIARFDGVTRVNIIDSQEITGPIYNIIDRVESFFKRSTRTVPQIIGFERIDISEYPYEAIREALINAIAHRDYNRKGAPIMFSIFDDRVEISSPGGLVSGVTLQNIGTKHEARNSRICAIFHETKDMEKFGTGIQKMRHYMQQHGLKEPEFRLEDNSFVVVFYGPGDKILDLASKIPDDRKVDLKAIGLNDRQIKALEMMINQRIVFTNSKYQKQFDVSRYTASRDLKGIVDKDQAYVIGKGKATKYKSTANDEA